MFNTTDDVRRRVAELTALPMFCLSLLFLVVLTVLVMLWVDVPMVFTPHEGESIDQPISEAQTDIRCWISVQTAFESGYDCVLILELLWPIFLLEFLWQYL